MKIQTFAVLVRFTITLLLLIVIYACAAQAQTESVIYSFTWEPDGAGPTAGLIMDTAGNLYGTTSYGGSGCGGSGCGTLFKVAASGAETELYTFAGGADGSNPNASLVLDSQGNVYGTASAGGDLTCGEGGVGCGTVFKLDAAGNFAVLYTFTGDPDGKDPSSPLVFDSAR